jgi:hypothetical protein
MIVIYAAVVVRAVQVVLIHKTESEVFSIDYIWYNSLLTVGLLSDARCLSIKKIMGGVVSSSWI